MIKSKRRKLTLAEKLNVIGPRIRRGDFSNLARTLNYDISHVRRVLIGESGPNTKIINEAYKRIGRRTKL